MTEEQINAPIQTLIAFGEGKARVQQVRWRGRLYRITETPLVWREVVGAQEHIMLSAVTVGGAVMTLRFIPHTLSWTLDRISNAE